MPSGPSSKCCMLESNFKQNMDATLSKLKENLFQFMNDLEVFKHNIEQIFSAHKAGHEMKQLLGNACFQLISCILECIHKKVLQIKSLFDFKNKEDHWSSKT